MTVLAEFIEVYYTMNSGINMRERISRLWEIYAYNHNRGGDVIDSELLVKAIYLAECTILNDSKGLDDLLEWNPHFQDDINLLCINILLVYREKNFHKCQEAVDFLNELASNLSN